MSVMRRVTIYSTLSVIIVLLAAAIIGLANQPRKADADSCAIYRAVYKTEILRYDDVGSKVAIKPKSISDDEVLDYRAVPPNIFIRDTEQTEIVTSYLGEQVESIITEEFLFDSSAFFSGEFPTKTHKIRNCFSGLENQPLLEDIDYRVIMNNEKNNYGDDTKYIILWSFTTPVFSEDRQHAIIYIEYYCGGLCGQGYYMLLKKSDVKWTPIGIHLLWVS